MSIDDLLRAVVQHAAEAGCSRPRRLRIEYDDPRDLIDVPVTGARTPGRKYVDPTSEDDPVETAIIEALMDAETRLTSGVLFDRLERENDGESGFSKRNLQRVISKLVKAGEVVNYAKDPGDGMGRGYGMP